MMKRRNIAIMAMLALTAGQAFAQRCLPQMKGIEVKVGMADGVYNGKKSCKERLQFLVWDILNRARREGHLQGRHSHEYADGSIWAAALLAFWKQRLEYLLINLGRHETIKLVMPCVGVRILL